MYGGYTDMYGVDGGYGGGGYDPYGAAYVPAGPPLLVEDSYYAVDPYAGGFGDPYGDPYGGGAFVDPYGGGGFVDPYGGYGGGPMIEEVYVEPYMDMLNSAGYNGPWPSTFYEPRPPPCRKEESSDSDSDDDSCGKRKHCHHHRARPQGVTQADISMLLDKFEKALQVKYKRAEIIELDQQAEVMKDLAKEKRDIQRQIAQAKRDLLLKDALAFNAGSRVPGRPPPQGKQVVSIDFGNKQPALPAPSRGGASIYSSGAYPTAQPAQPLPPQQPQPPRIQYKPQMPPHVVYH